MYCGQRIWFIINDFHCVTRGDGFHFIGKYFLEITFLMKFSWMMFLLFLCLEMWHLCICMFISINTVLLFTASLCPPPPSSSLLPPSSPPPFLFLLLLPPSSPPSSSSSSSSLSPLHIPAVESVFSVVGLNSVDNIVSLSLSLFLTSRLWKNLFSCYSTFSSSVVVPSSTSGLVLQHHGPGLGQSGRRSILTDLATFRQTR